MNRLIVASSLLFAATIRVHAQDLQGYLHMRRSYGIVESVGVPALETLIGTRVFEVQGTIDGTLRVGSRTSILLERTDGDTQAIDADTVPDWAVGTKVSARLIIRATRSDERDEVHAVLLGVARDEDIAPIEARWLAAAVKKAALHRKQPVSTKARGSRDKYAMNMKPPTTVWVVPPNEAYARYMSYIRKENPRLDEPEAYRITDGIFKLSRAYGVDPRLIVAMVVCESDFNPNEVSRSGAMGLGQLMPETVQDYGIHDPFDSVENLKGTVREIRSHIDKYEAEFGDPYHALVLGLAAYNAGEGAVRRHGEDVPPYPETQSYVRKVIHLFLRLKGYRD